MNTPLEIMIDEPIPQVRASDRKGLALPVEIIEQILLRLADQGSESAVKAALVHPAFKKVCIERMFINGVTAHIKKPSTLNTLVRQLMARGVPISIDLLRYQPATFCSLKQKENVRRVLDHLLGVGYHIEDLQLRLPVDRLLFNQESVGALLFLPQVRKLSILHGPYPLERIGIALFITEITLVQPTSHAIWTLRLLPHLQKVYLFFIEDDEPDIEGSWSELLHKYALCCRKGIIDELTAIKYLRAKVIYFIIMDGDPHPECFIQAIGHMYCGKSRHDFYRYWATSGMNEFQRLDRAKLLIKQWEQEHPR